MHLQKFNRNCTIKKKLFLKSITPTTITVVDDDKLTAQFAIQIPQIIPHIDRVSSNRSEAETFHAEWLNDPGRKSNDICVVFYFFFNVIVLLPQHFMQLK